MEKKLPTDLPQSKTGAGDSLKTSKKGLEEILQELQSTQLSDEQVDSGNAHLTSSFDRCFNKFDRCFNKFDRCFNKFERN